MTELPTAPLRERLLHVLRGYAALPDRASGRVGFTSADHQVLHVHRGRSVFEAPLEQLVDELLFALSPELADLEQARATLARVRELALDPAAEWMYITPSQLLDALDADLRAAQIAKMAATGPVVVPEDLLPAVQHEQEVSP